MREQQLAYVPFEHVEEYLQRGWMIVLPTAEYPANVW